jgi:hypothetical protein
MRRVQLFILIISLKNASGLTINGQMAVNIIMAILLGIRCSQHGFGASLFVSIRKIINSTAIGKP